jgi:nitrite reductase (NADH) small subunit
MDEHEATAPTLTWVPICHLDDILPSSGVCALVGTTQIAVFRVDDRLYAIGNRDPKSGANVLSRGIVGDRGGVPKVASPLYKQNFSLETGICLDDPDVRVPTYPVRCHAGIVEVAG